MVSEQKMFRSSSNYQSVRANEPMGIANLDLRGMAGRIYVGDHLTLQFTKYLISAPYSFRGEDFLSFSHYMSLGANEPLLHYKSMGANEPWGLASLDPKGMIGRIYVGDHLMLLHTKYLSSGPYDFREEDLKFFSHYKCMGDNEPRGMARLIFRGMVGRIYVGDRLTLLHTKYLKSVPYGFRE